MLKRRAVKQDIDEELRFHLENCRADHIAAGMSPDEAARKARRRRPSFTPWPNAMCRQPAPHGTAAWSSIPFRRVFQLSTAWLQLMRFS